MTLIRRLILFLPAAIIMGSAASCVHHDHETDDVEPSVPTARMTIIFSSSSAESRSSNLDERPGETDIRNLEVMIFRATGEESSDNGIIDAHKTLTGEELSAGTVTIDVSTGPKHVFLTANTPEGMFDTTETESEFLSAISLFTDNNPGALVMVGTAGADVHLVAGASSSNRLRVPLRRLVSRVGITKVTGDLASPALRQKDFSIRRIYLTWVPKSAPLVNGDEKDVFGTPYDKYIGESVIKGIYDFPVPENDEGFHNVHVVDTEGKVSIDPDVAPFTLKEFQEGEGKLFASPESPVSALPSHTWKPEDKVFFYTYPNCTDPSDEGPDRVTKLVIETEYDGHLYYYPISICYPRPGYSYTISDVFLTRLGTVDPNTPVEVADCSFTVTVTKWYSGEVVGKYNSVDEGQIVF